MSERSTPLQHLAENLARLQNQVPFMQAYASGDLATQPNEELLEIQREAKLRIATHTIGLLTANPEAGNAFATGLVEYTNYSSITGVWFETKSGRRTDTTHVTLRISPAKETSTPPVIYLEATAERRDALERVLQEQFVYPDTSSDPNTVQEDSDSEELFHGWQVHEVTTVKKSGKEDVRYGAYKPFTAVDGAYHFSLIIDLASRMADVYDYLIGRGEEKLRRVHTIDQKNYQAAHALVNALLQVDPHYVSQYSLKQPQDPTRLIPRRTFPMYHADHSDEELDDIDFDEE